MIEFLQNSDWINPQLDFLTLLQTIRMEHFECLNGLFLSITTLGELWLPTIICAIVYWCIDTKSGIYLFSLFGFQLLIGQFFKMIACVYRPWILSDKIHPVELAVPAAKGYSFPSGHSATASSILGGLAYLYRKNKIICIFLILTVLCVGFSRMWLGVHTPQDVIVGFSIGIILIFAVNILINKAEEKKNLYVKYLFIINLAAILVLIYICYFNEYRIDYIDGKILVNPEGAKYSLVNCYGYALGLINGAFLCRRYVKFDASQGSLKSKITRGIVGAILVFFIFKFIFVGFLFKNVYDYKFAIMAAFTTGMFVTCLYPYIIMKIENNLKK